MPLVGDFGFWDFEGIRDKHPNYHSVFTISEESQHIDVEACSRDKVTTLSAWYSNHLKSSPLNKSSASTTGIQIVSIVTMIKGCETHKIQQTRWTFNIDEVENDFEKYCVMTFNLAFVSSFYYL